MSSEAEKLKQMEEARRDVLKFLEHARDGKTEELRGLLRNYAAEHGGSEADIITAIKDGNGRNMLHFAAASDHAATVGFLLSACPAARDTRDDGGLSPLALALITGSKAAATALLDAGADPNLADKDGVSCAHRAAGAGDVAGLEMLALAGANLDAKSSSGGTPLHWAVGEHGPHVAATVAALLRLGARPDPSNAAGLTPLLIAVAAGSGAAAALLVEAGADAGHLLVGGMTVLHVAADLGLTEAVKGILKTDSGRRCAALRTDAGLLPLHLAAMAATAASHLEGGSSGGDGEGSNDGSGSAWEPKELDVVASSGPEGARQCCELLAPISSLGDNGEEGTGAATTLTVSMEALGIEARALMAKHEEASLKEEAAAAEAGAASSGAGGSSGGADSNGDGDQDWGNEPTAPARSPEDAAEAAALKEKGNAAYVAKDVPRAIELWSASILLNGSAAATWSNRSAALLATGRPRAALRDAEVCQRLRPDWSKAFYRVASARLALGLFEDAAVAAFEGLKLDDKNEELQALLQTCVQRGREEHLKGQAGEGDSGASKESGAEV